MASRRLTTVLAVVVISLCLVAQSSSVPIPDVEDAEETEPPASPTRSPALPRVDAKDLGLPDEYDEYYDEDPDYITWDDLGRMIYSWAKLFAEPKQMKHLRKCLTGNAPRDAAGLIKRIESCVRIVDPDFSLKKFASLLIGS